VAFIFDESSAAVLRAHRNQTAHLNFDENGKKLAERASVGKHALFSVPSLNGLRAGEKDERGGKDAHRMVVAAAGGLNRREGVLE
jgi:hypothetical protein